MFVRPSSTQRVAAAAGLAALAAVALAAPASAHVTVSADDPQQGASDSVLTFRVPNEESAATSVKLTISFPTKTPLPSVKPAPKQGWTVSTTTTTFTPPITTDDGTITDGVSQVVYTAKTAADGIPVGGFDTFQILVGPIPAKATSLAFPTVQGYSDGKTVSWIQPTLDPANPPDNPAPVLHLVAAGAGADGGSGASPAVSLAPVAAGDGASSPTSPTVSDVDTARNLGITGIVLGILAVLGAAAAILRGRGARV